MKAKLKDLLRQDDLPGTDWDDATVHCEASVFIHKGAKNSSFATEDPFVSNTIDLNV